MQLAELIEKCDFTSSAAAFQRLAGFGIHEAHDSYNIKADEIPHLTGISATLDSVLADETSRTTVILTDFEPPAELMRLAGLQPRQQLLVRDLEVCLKAHLARPAIVMAWALGYDIIRSWVFSDTTGRLAAFNTELAKLPRPWELAAVRDYHDFFPIGENRFLNLCNNSPHASLKDFQGNVFRGLVALLDQRNEFAHVNDSVANESEADAYVRRIVRAVTSPPFI